MMRAAGLEWYEQGDVWHRVITARNTALPSATFRRNSSTAAVQEIRPLLLADSDTLLRPGGPLEPVAEWAAAFRRTGQALADGVQAGTMDRGLRQVLSYHVIFHWNRLGLSMRGQSVLAWAARAAILQGGDEESSHQPTHKVPGVNQRNVSRALPQQQPRPPDGRFSSAGPGLSGR